MEPEKRVCGSYTSDQSILVVGDGDFSFCFSLCSKLRSGYNLIATSYDSYEILTTKYTDSLKHTEEIKAMGSIVLHGVDATNLQETLILPNENCPVKYDRIIFQFPLVYAQPNKQSYLSDPDPCLRNRRLIREFFHSAMPLLKENVGQIHISSKETRPYIEWNIESLAKGFSPFGYLQKYPFEKDHFTDYKSRNVMHPDGFPLTFAFTYVYGFDSDSLPLANLDFQYDKTAFPYACLYCKKKFVIELDEGKHCNSLDHKRAVKLAQNWVLELEKITIKWDNKKLLEKKENEIESEENAIPITINNNHDNERIEEEDEEIKGKKRKLSDENGPNESNALNG
jgi:25S rRNA (uracil2634-N3)-methyltransferase